MMLTRATSHPTHSKTLGICVLLVGSALSAFAQTNAAATAGRIPRLTDGHPNLNGIWQTINTANIDLLDHASKQ